MLRWVVLACCLTGIACGKGTPSNNGDAPPAGVAELRARVLHDVVELVIEPAHAGAHEAAVALRDATEAWASSGDADDLTAAQEAWKVAMLAWQRVEVYRFGPAGAMGSDVGGLDLRDDVYSWPTRNPCRVDQELVAQTYAQDATLAAAPVNVRGLAALEYLLFHTEPTNQCDPARSINQDGSWAALSEAQIAEHRAQYAAASARLVVAAIEELQAQWAGGFAQEFQSAGNGSTLFASRQEALNTYSNALMFVELDMKELKLGAPGGILMCAQPTCPEAREFWWFDLNFPAIAENLDAFLVGFTGADGHGFDDLLEEIGQGALAAEMIAAANAARDAAANAPPMTASLQDGPDAVVAVYDANKVLTDLLKTQFISVLDLELPQQAEGDND